MPNPGAMVVTNATVKPMPQEQFMAVGGNTASEPAQSAPNQHDAEWNNLSFATACAGLPLTSSNTAWMASKLASAPRLYSQRFGANASANTGKERTAPQRNRIVC